MVDPAGREDADTDVSGGLAGSLPFELLVGGVDFFHAPLGQLAKLRCQVRYLVGMVLVYQSPVGSVDLLPRRSGADLQHLIG